MRKYKSHKIVEAAVIIGMSEPVNGQITFVLADKDPETDSSVMIEAPESIISRYVPREGDYLVRYRDGYMAISPGKEFEDGYALAEDTDYGSFSWALFWIKGGKRVARQGWNGKDMFIFLVPGSHFVVNRPPLLGIYPEGTEIDYHDHIDMRTADGQIVPWLASQTDMLANDWQIIS